jgi:hypothetical protein
MAALRTIIRTSSPAPRPTATPVAPAPTRPAPTSLAPAPTAIKRLPTSMTMKAPVIKPVISQAMRDRLQSFVPAIKQRLAERGVTPNDAMNYLPGGGGSGGGGVAQAAQALMTAGGGMGGIILAVALVGGFLYLNSGSDKAKKAK